MLNIKDLVAGKKTIVEAPKPKPVGRPPKKRPKSLEAVIKIERPDIDKDIGKVMKPKLVVEAVYTHNDNMLECIDDAFEDCSEEEAEDSDEIEAPLHEPSTQTKGTQN